MEVPDALAELLRLISPALIAAATTLVVLLLKDLVMVRRQRRQFACKLLLHFARQQLLLLRAAPGNSQFIGLQALEQYVDVYLSNATIERAFEQISGIHLQWRSGAFVDASNEVLARSSVEIQTSMTALGAAP